MLLFRFIVLLMASFKLFQNNLLIGPKVCGVADPLRWCCYLFAECQNPSGVIAVDSDHLLQAAGCSDQVLYQPIRVSDKYAVSQFRVCILWRIQSSRSSEAESFRETLLTSSVVVKCDGLAFGAFPGCVTRCFTLTSWFLPPRPARVTTYATWCRHIRSVFLIFRAREESWDMRGHEG